MGRGRGRGYMGYGMGRSGRVGVGEVEERGRGRWRGRGVGERAEQAPNGAGSTRWALHRSRRARRCNSTMAKRMPTTSRAAKAARRAIQDQTTTTCASDGALSSSGPTAAPPPARVHADSSTSRTLPAQASATLIGSWLAATHRSRPRLWEAPCTKPSKRHADASTST